jgi:hypothetical protein
MTFRWLDHVKGDLEDDSRLDQPDPAKILDCMCLKPFSQLRDFDIGKPAIRLSDVEQLAVLA